MTYASFNPELDPEIAGWQFSLRRVGTFAGAEITGLDLTRPLEKQTVEALKLAHASYGVLVFPDQKINAEDLKRFHGTNERLSVSNYADAIRFYQRLARQATSVVKP